MRSSNRSWRGCCGSMFSRRSNPQPAGFSVTRWVCVSEKTCQVAENLAGLGRRSTIRVLFPASLLVILLSACGPATPSVAPQIIPAAPVTVHALPLREDGPCLGQFVAHDLHHITSTDDGEVRMFEANGAGVGIGDLDNDGDLDLVFGNYDGPNSIFWNEGDLRFRQEEMPIGRTRAVALVDVDADGRLDIVLTRTTGAVNYWRNLGNGEFAQEFLRGFAQPAYVIDWADVDGDGDLDAVTASYDAALLTDLGNSYLINGGGGVYLHTNQNLSFTPLGLATEAQALAIALWDANDDGKLDIQVGNDFAVRDFLWLQSADGWQPDSPFRETSYSTMSYDLGDVDNRGDLALFATDMKPYTTDPRVLAVWAPLMRDLWFSPEEDDPQRQENALLLLDRDQFQNRAYPRRADATGWSWSGVFGDLDSDGWLDLYVVNGFIEYEIFSYLPNHELVEENQVLRNTGRGEFERRPDWGLGSTRSGRGMAMGDLDGDGDLDIVVNNLRGAAQLFENRLCGGDNLLVDLRWPSSPNINAVGATVFVETNQGRLRRDVRVTRGYLSSSVGPLHFGLDPNAVIERVEVHWPDRAISVVDNVAPDVTLLITR
ncbi:CRTAC1 family protein [bacterium]|nr:CRTAC1 family protein [bacterium]